MALVPRIECPLDPKKRGRKVHARHDPLRKKLKINAVANKTSDTREQRAFTNVRLELGFGCQAMRTGRSTGELPS